jgi:hypothetical protein
MSGALALVALAVTMQLPRVTLPDTHDVEA